MPTRNKKRTTQAQNGPTGPTTATAAAVASGDKDSSAPLVNTSDKAPNAPMVAQLVNADDVRLCAYQKWEKAGKPTGDGIQFWLDAELEVVHA